MIQKILRPYSLFHLSLAAVATPLSCAWSPRPRLGLRPPLLLVAPAGKRATRARMGTADHNLAAKPLDEPSKLALGGIAALAAASVFTMGGVVFGFSSLYPVLYSEGALIDVCEADAAAACLETAATTKCCNRQLSAFTTMSTIAFFAADMAMALYGELIDRFGPRVCFATGVGLCWLGFATLAGASFFHTVDALWYASFFCIGMSGPGVFMATLSLGERYPSLQAVIAPLAASMWDSSSVVFLLLQMLYFHGPPIAKHSLAGVASGWLFLSFVVGSPMGLILPAQAVLERMREADVERTRHDQEERSRTRDEQLVSDSSSIELDQQRRQQQPPPPPPVAADTSLVAQFLRADTLLLLTLMSVYNLKSSFFIVSFSDQARSFGFAEGTPEALDLTFNVAFPLGGLLASIVGILLLHAHGRSPHVYMGAVILIVCSFSIPQLFPSPTAQYAAALLFGPARTIQWACYFHFLSNSGRYPQETVGRLIGYGNVVIALVGDLPPSLLQSYALHGLWPATVAARYQAVHAVLTVPLLGCAALPLYLYRAHLRERVSALELT
jgi:MFS family permease